MEIGFFNKLSFFSPLFQIPAILLVTVFFGLFKLIPVLLLTGAETGVFIDALLFDRYLSCVMEVGKLGVFFGDGFFSAGVVGILEDVTRVGGFSLETVVLVGVVDASFTTGTFSSVGSS